MQYKDLLRGTVLLVAIEATGAGGDLGDHDQRDR